MISKKSILNLRESSKTTSSARRHSTRRRLSSIKVTSGNSTSRSESWRKRVRSSSQTSCWRSKAMKARFQISSHKYSDRAHWRMTLLSLLQMRKLDRPRELWLEDTLIWASTKTWRKVLLSQRGSRKKMMMPSTKRELGHLQKRRFPRTKAQHQLRSKHLGSLSKHLDSLSNLKAAFSTPLPLSS